MYLPFVSIVSVLLVIYSAGAKKDFRNSEGKLPYDLAAKFPDAAKQLKVTLIPAQFSADYGDEEDSD